MLLAKFFWSLIVGCGLVMGAAIVPLPPIPGPNVIWKPIPGTSQEIALDSRCNETLYTGTRGPGKTEIQLMKFRKNVGIGYGAFWRGIIFDREYKHLDDLVAKSKRLFYKFNDGAKFLESPHAYKWVWPTGEELLFRVIKKREDYDNYHGQEYPFIGWNELCKYPTSELYDLMLSCNRSSFTLDKDGQRDQKGRLVTSDLPPIPLEVFATTNSKGPGHGWVKRRFIDLAPYGKVVRVTRNVFNPRTQQQEDVTRTQVAIFGSYRENIFLDPQYVAGLESIQDENTRKSWLLGDWNVVCGGAFDDVWRDSIHILPRFKVPVSWHVDRSFDWGSTHPFCCAWWAEANGEEADIALPDGKVIKFCPPPGTLIQVGEIYGTKEIGTNVGLRMGSSKVAEAIRDYEIVLLREGWIKQQPMPGPADNQIRDVHDSDEVDTIEIKMAKKGIRWLESDKSPGSRRNGFELFRERLENALNKAEDPAIYFMANCRGSIATIPILERDEDKQDDVDTESEDHPYDSVRYRVLKGNNRWARSLRIQFPN